MGRHRQVRTDDATKPLTASFDAASGVLADHELAEALGGPHLQLGPSHFMRSGLDEKRLGQIWKYNIEPFIEDQFFGDPSQIDRFQFHTVLRRYRSAAGFDDASVDLTELERAEVNPGGFGSAGSEYTGLTGGFGGSAGSAGDEAAEGI